jgi:hypothetical protein
MSVTDRQSGITTEHISRIEGACRSLNVFLFVRPTEYDTTRLIQQGYATKSMSVHDKSSNWGPMAGFVPCDQFFSKKYIGVANPNPHFHDHGPARVVQLKLTDALVECHDKMTLVSGARGATTRIYRSPQAESSVARAIEFQLEKAGDGWNVFWLSSGKKVPLYVWGYVVNGTPTPVTGDYDLWMVAPHMSWWKLHLQAVGVVDEHGSSGATLLITWLLAKLNEACGRADNPVFNHGAEAQNYGFTQALDSRFAMFTPAGTSRMVDRSDMPEILNDLQNAAYLMYWNKRYGEMDPRLSGQAYPMAGLLKELSGQLEKLGRPGQGGVLRHLASKDQKLRDIVDIRLFYNRLKQIDAGLQTRSKPKVLRVGEREDLLPDYLEKAGERTFAAQRALQQAVVDATIGGGESDLDRLESWIDQNIDHVFTLCESFGEAPGTGGGPESGFLLQKIPGTSAYKRA